MTLQISLHNSLTNHMQKAFKSNTYNNYIKFYQHLCVKLPFFGKMTPQISFLQ